MIEPIIQDPLSAVSIRLQMMFNTTCIGVATGFLYRTASGVYLITNRHVVTGRNERDECLDKACAVPNWLHGWVYIANRIDEHHAGYTRCLQDFPLYDADGQARWFEHPLHGGSVDVAAVLIQNAEQFFSFQDIWAELSAFQLRPLMDGCVVGYPLGIAIEISLPIWKRCTLASEPDFPIDGLPQRYIDTATRSGMSGSPVYAVKPRVVASEGVIGIGYMKQFIGVYSGRVGTDDFQAQLGRVWRPEVIDEIIEGRRPGASSL